MCHKQFKIMENTENSKKDNLSSVLFVFLRVVDVLYSSLFNWYQNMEQQNALEDKRGALTTEATQFPAGCAQFWSLNTLYSLPKVAGNKK